MAWAVETLNEVVDAELEELPADVRARFVRISTLIEEFGLERVREPHVKHLRGLSGALRHRVRQRVVVVRVFVKKTHKTPSREIELALKRAKGLLE